ncbi:uncharacterized protein BDZ83DRAFT_364644 [Colletotrichum acutatum]|uniref:Uncharacterized protein n=1 Tax=Glomerella acutata TaxID=27357 RepID=A0AAD8XDR0_GLOAC|nr:uncharacterized protein BDZ83DRAFT_364644 [Colletotrichum acutatum]KAK1724004.1 hypothetical protein BDZ83DRAFT_364644 [Colletotrichum acutatum]
MRYHRAHHTLAKMFIIILILAGSIRSCKTLFPSRASGNVRFLVSISPSLEYTAVSSMLYTVFLMDTPSGQYVFLITAYDVLIRIGRCFLLGLLRRSGL